MNALQLLADLLRRLPRRARQIIYTTWTLLGGVLAAWQYLDPGDLGSLSSTRALEIYVTLTPLFGTLAAVNTAKPRETEIVDYGEDLEAVGSFDPVDDPDAVYA